MIQKITGNKTIGKNIRLVRMRQRFTQEQLAAKLQIGGCDISRGTLAKIESGIRNISAMELKIMKEVLGMQYEDFFEE